MKFFESISLKMGLALLSVLTLFSCSTTKYISDGQYLLEKTDIESKAPGIDAKTLESYLCQQPNFKVFGISRIRLATYNMSGRDTSKRRNRWLKRMGEPPVVYDPYLTVKSEKKLQQYFKTKGYLNAQVTSTVEYRKKRAYVVYHVQESQPYRVRHITLDYHNDTVLGNIFASAKYSETKLDSGMLFDSDVLNAERARLTTLARRRGYYFFTKDNISYMVDSSLDSHQVDVTLQLKPYYVSSSNGDVEETLHPRYTVKQINVLMLSKSSAAAQPLSSYDSTTIKPGVVLYYDKKPLVRQHVLADNIRLYPGMWYNDIYVDRTYNKFSTLDVIKSTDIHFRDLRTADNELECNITLTPNKIRSFSLDLEGTNSEGDLGFAVSSGLEDRNLFHGSEVLGFKMRVSEEAISNTDNKIPDILNKNALELDGELSLKIPRFVFPFLSSSFKQKVNSSTEFTLAYDNQKRPEYNRIITTAGTKYVWNVRRYYSYSIDAFNLNYVYIPWMSASFEQRYADSKYSVLRYSYSDHFIFDAGAAMTFDNESSTRHLDKTSYKISFESAGNLLYGISTLTHQNKYNGAYQIANIPYSQYVKGEFEYALNKYVDDKNRLVFHIKTGVEFPYGNAEMVPFEKRFFAGGANGVRGWAVRTLGPGTYTSPNSEDFVSQSGNIELTANMEYRSKLFWKFEGAAFVDAGNIWNIKNYDFQPEGTFHLDEFYKQIAMAYGLGLRCDFTYFLIRLDVGMKAYDPALPDGERWRYHDITWSDDFAFHFAIGYPF